MNSEIIQNAGLADGLYAGTWGGYVVDVQLPGGAKCSLDTKTGIRTPNAPVSVKVVGNVATVTLVEDCVKKARKEENIAEAIRAKVHSFMQDDLRRLEDEAAMLLRAGYAVDEIKIVETFSPSFNVIRYAIPKDMEFRPSAVTRSAGDVMKEYSNKQ